MHTPVRVLLLSAVALVLAGVLAAATASDAPPTVAPAPTTTAAVAPPEPPATPAPTPAPLPTTPGFPAIPAGEHVRAVRTPNGMLLPAVGAQDGRWQVMTPCAGVAAVPGRPVHGAHIVLDPGHGGREPGAVGPSGLREADLNLDIALRVRDLLRAEGATVVLTRNRDVRITLATRAAIARALEPLAFVSIHHNAAPLGKATTPGSELYHQLDAPGSRRLAGLLWEELQAGLSPFGTDWAVGDQPGARARRSARTGDDYYGVLRQAEDVTAVLTEAAFLTNPAEDALLRTEEFRHAEAQAIATAILRFVRTSDPGSGFVPTKEVSTPAGGGGGSTGCVDPPLT
ncbi:MAG TPA: N-acetylmuramoyl-L-alanine amidase [Acidimicrobiales bacterium]|nr:N-acetylmuramoyl-L-alanine amidase [Acidimicrobiales bacterium]